MAVAWYLAITSFTGMVDDLTTGPIPDAKLTLQAGDQAVFLEGDLANGVHKCRCPRAKASSVVITDLNGKVVPTQHTNRNVFRKNSMDGVQIAQVTIPADGRYRVRTDAPVGEKIAIGDYKPNHVLFIAASGLSFVAVICANFFIRARKERGSAIVASAEAPIQVQPPSDPSAPSRNLDTVILQLAGLESQKEFQSPEAVQILTKDLLDYALGQGQINQADYDRLRREHLGPTPS